MGIPDAIIIVDSTSGEGVYELEFADSMPCVILSLEMDIEDITPN